jgi:hypothetical protein
MRTVECDSERYVSGADAGDVDQSADTPSIGQPKLTTET